MNLEDFVINGLTIFIIYKALIGSFKSLKYIFFIWIGLVLYFRGLKSGSFFYRTLIKEEEVEYIIRPLKEFI